MTMFSDLLRQDCESSGSASGQAARRFGVTVREYRKFEAGQRVPSWET